MKHYIYQFLKFHQSFLIKDKSKLYYRFIKFIIILYKTAVRHDLFLVTSNLYIYSKRRRGPSSSQPLLLSILTFLIHDADN